MVPGLETSVTASGRNMNRSRTRWATTRGRWGALALAWVLALVLGRAASPVVRAGMFDGGFYRGEGAVEDLRLLDIARRMFTPDPEFQNLSMLYTPQWNGMVEGPTWGAWWVQNSYGTTYGALPFLEEPFITFLQNSQDLWFDRMGDGRTSYVWNGKDSWVPPDGCLMDAASDTWAIHRQGDGRVAIHDWGIEFTAAGGLLQSELLLIGRDRAAIDRYLPKLERCAAFVESRRDPATDLFWVGPAGNLLAPSFAGYRKPDGTYGMAYLAGLSVSYIAFLDRLAELEKVVGRTAMAAELEGRRERARKGLARLTTPAGYLVKSMDPDGTLHGVYGAPRHGYFEASPNHDAICFRVVDDTQARRIFDVISGIPGLRPHGLIVANCPSLDDMYEEPRGLWGFGTWVNGGHWTTCEARMMMAYHRVGAFSDARRSMEQILRFARQFRLDNPLVEFGNAVYQPKEPINITYDAFGAPAGFVRGLFEYLYRADGLTLVPHMPPNVDRLEQKFPVRLGTKRLYLAMSGHGAVEGVWINGKRWKHFDATSVHLTHDSLPARASVEIVLTGGRRSGFTAPRPKTFRAASRLTKLAASPVFESATTGVKPVDSSIPAPGEESAKSTSKPKPKPEIDPQDLLVGARQLAVFEDLMKRSGLERTYEAAHARLTVEALEAAVRHREAVRAGKMPRLPDASEAAADRLYWETTSRLVQGLEKRVNQIRTTTSSGEARKLIECWDRSRNAAVR